MKTENICQKCGKFFKRTIANYQNKPKFCSMVCRGHTGFKPGGSFRITECSEHERHQRLLNNFEKLVIKKNGCWDWSGKIEKNGYAKLSCRALLGARHAHRASYLLYKGSIPQGLQINHLCGNRKCSNPDHLYLGTQKQNMNDAVMADHQAKGSKNGNSKLQEDDIKKIKIHLSKGEDISYIASLFGVTKTQIYNIKKNKQWKHVQEEPCLRTS
jgi:hypothetical protein